MELPSSKLFLQAFIGFSLVLSLLALYQTYDRIEELHVVFWQSKWVILIAGYFLNLLIGIWFMGSSWQEARRNPLDRLDDPPQGMPGRILALILAVLGPSLFWLLRSRIFFAALPQTFPALWLFWWCSLLAAVGIKWLTRSSWASAFAAILLFQGILFVSYGKLRYVTDYPFSIGYSEASRYYYGSLLFSKSIYGIRLPLSAWHATRYFLLSIPFLIQGLPLWAHRLWQALLWIGMTGGSAYALVRRLHLNYVFALFVAAWFYIYSFQGAVYYHLHIMVMIILLGVSAQHPWRSLLSVLLASFWAGMSRVNWFPVPALLATALYLLEEPFDQYLSWWRYLKRPLSWGVLGTVTAFLSQEFYILWSGNAEHPEFFTSSFSSPLLWYRLLPNASYALGVLPGILIVSAPLWIILYLAARGRARNVHWLRWLGLLSMILVLFVGGLVVSVKIGGGAELHNMDAYMVMLSVAAVYFVGNQVAVEKQAPAWRRVSWPAAVLALIVPIGFAVTNVTPYGTYDHALAENNLQALRRTVTQAAQNHGEVLFINERQLLTFNMIQDVPLVSQYELVTLMEMAMSRNLDYLNQFYDDLHRHRFALIVARKQGTSIQDTEESFADENNAWNTMIAAHLLCEYEPVLTLQGTALQIYAPRSGERNCP